MNCSTCRTQLPPGAANCPQCGATTPYYYSHAGITPNDPTVVSSPYTDAPQPPTPTLYGSPSYGEASPSSYSSPSYHNPYEPYDVAPSAPPPSPNRPGNRIGIIVGAVLLVLLLIGGGVFAWIAYSSAGHTAAANTPATATATVAPQHFTAQGTFTIVSRTLTSVRQDGQNKIYSYTLHEVDYGDVMGSYTSEETDIVHPDNTSNFSGTSTCTCTVQGKSGILMWSYTGMSTANGSFQGQTFDGHATGDLAKLHGSPGEFQGQGLHGTYSSDLYFDS